MSDIFANPFASSLGEAVLTQWGSLPRDIQRLLFETAAERAEAAGETSFRDSLAVFLHERHPRTDDA